MKMHEIISEGLKDPKDNPCWKGYHPVGTKKKNGRTVPNCVPGRSDEAAMTTMHPRGEKPLSPSLDAPKKKYPAIGTVAWENLPKHTKVMLLKKRGHNPDEYFGTKTEAANPAQQAAIAINMKKAGKKPKHNEEQMEEGVDIRNRPVPQIQTAIARSKKIPNSKVIKLGPNRGYVVVDRSDPRPEVKPDLTVTGKVSNANQRYRDLYVQMRRLERKYNTDAPGHPELRDANWQKMLQNTNYNQLKKEKQAATAELKAASKYQRHTEVESVEEGWKSAAAGAALMGIGAMGAGGQAQAADMNKAGVSNMKAPVHATQAVKHEQLKRYPTDPRPDLKLGSLEDMFFNGNSNHDREIRFLNYQTDPDKGDMTPQQWSNAQGPKNSPMKHLTPDEQAARKKLPLRTANWHPDDDKMPATIESVKEGWKDAAAGAAMLGAVGVGGAHMMANADTSRVDGKDFYRYHGSVTDRIADKMHPAVDDKGREVYVWIDKIAKPSGVNRYYIPAKEVVKEDEIPTYIVSVMDSATGEHRSIEVKVTSPEAARERAKARGYKVLSVKEKQGVGEGLKSMYHTAVAKHHGRKADQAWDMDDEEGFQKHTDKNISHRLKAGEKVPNVPNPERFQQLQKGVKEGETSDTTWKVTYDYGPHQSNTIHVKAKSSDDAWQVAKKEAAEKHHHSRIMAGQVTQVKEKKGVAEDDATSNRLRVEVTDKGAVYVNNTRITGRGTKWGRHHIVAQGRVRPEYIPQWLIKNGFGDIRLDPNYAAEFGIPVQQGVSEGGPFSYGAKKPRKGSVADLAAKKRKEQERGQQPIEPKDQMVGVAKVTKGVKEGEETGPKFTGYWKGTDKGKPGKKMVGGN